MKDSFIPLELLAPAKNPDFGKEAINHGADAVYIGAPSFGARMAASNTISGIEDLVTYAHFFNAKVYIAFNTILFDHEFDQALKLIHQLYNAGIDGLIIQDMGLLELNLPAIPLIASTQTHNATVSKIKFFENVGFKRVILARELSLSEIAEIRSQTTIELESFVHGALCMSYSGQCYMSQAICNRSGNRGECAQPCRSHYDLVDSSGTILEKDKYLLSMKDLNLSTYVSQLIDAGISSFKIEGRLKDIGYLKNTVSYYRNTIDLILEDKNGFVKSSVGKCDFHFVADPERSFNRGFTNFNIESRNKNWITYNTQKALGKFIGNVTQLSDNYFLMTGEDLKNGDGICFFDAHKKLSGTLINMVKDNKIYPAVIKGLTLNTAIFRNNDITFEKKLQQTSSVRKIGADIQFTAAREKLRICMTDEEGNSCFMEKEGFFETAEKSETVREQLVRQLSKLGDSAFYLRNITLNDDFIPFVPQSVINSLRRDVVQALSALRHDNYPRSEKILTVNTFPYPEKKLNYAANVLNEQAKRFYQRHQACVDEMALEKTNDFSGKVLMTTKYCIRYQTETCPVHQNSGIRYNEPLYLKDKIHTYRLKFDCKRCVMEIILEK